MKPKEPRDRASIALASAAARATACETCPRLASYVASFRTDAEYWARPVAGFGDSDATVLILGLAPGAHGANRTGRPFTGDGAGIFLYRALHETGAASAPSAQARDDGLTLTGVFITNVVKCAPPANRPLPIEVAACARHLDAELAALTRVRAVLALGRVAHDAWLRRRAAAGARAKDHPFRHGAVHRFADGSPPLVDSFHPSRYNVNVGTLTYPMFRDVVRAARSLGVSAR